jgi:beta-alanine--pyruvate transaminase
MNKPAHLDMAAWEPTPNNLEAFFMGFTPNASFKKRPRLIARAKDMHYYDMKGRALIDASAGLWCSNAGHCRQPIIDAIQKQAAELDSRRPSSTATRRFSNWPRALPCWRRVT